MITLWLRGQILAPTISKQLLLVDNLACSRHHLIKLQSWWATAVEAQATCQFCQLMTQNLKRNPHNFTKIWKFQDRGKNRLAWWASSSTTIIRIWHNRHKNLDSSCSVSLVLAEIGDEMMRGVFSLQTLNHLAPITTLNVLNVGNSHFLLATSNTIMHQTTKSKSSHTCLLNMTMDSQYCWPLPPPDLSMFGR